MSDPAKNQKVIVANFKSDIPEFIPQELFDLILSEKGVKIERIVSKGQCSAMDDWYDQDQSEWVLLVSGAAVLEFQDPSQKVSLQTGDYLLIPPHKKHRVDWTDPDQETLWLAVFFS